jgi:hypothetical protein
MKRRFAIPTADAIRFLAAMGFVALATSCATAPATGTDGSGAVRFLFRLSPDTQVESGSLVLSAPNGRDIRCTLPGKADLTVPAGTYSMSNATVLTRNGGGVEWELRFSLPKPVCVASGQVTEVSFGSPLTATLSPASEKISLSGNSRLWLKIVGHGGEEYERIAPRKSRMIPSVKLTSEDGVVVVQSNIEYG